MAKTITIEFTDAQWEVIRDNYPANMKATDDEIVTLERVSEILLAEIKGSVLADMRNRELDLTPFRTVFDE